MEQHPDEYQPEYQDGKYVCPREDVLQIVNTSNIAGSYSFKYLCFNPSGVQ